MKGWRSDNSTVISNKGHNQFSNIAHSSEVAIFSTHSKLKFVTIERTSGCLPFHAYIGQR